MRDISAAVAPDALLSTLRTTFHTQALDLIQKLKAGGLAPNTGDHASFSAARQLEQTLGVAFFQDELRAGAGADFPAPEWFKVQVCEGLREVFRHLDEDGMQAGWDVDGAAKKFWNFEAPVVTCAALRYLDGSFAEPLRDVTTRLRRSAECALPRLEGYARNQTPAFRGINLIFADTACLHETGRFFGEQNWMELARLAKERALSTQDPEGFFPERRGTEDRGPSSVYMQFALWTIIPLLCAFPEDAVAERVRRAVDWVLKSVYPSTEPIDIFDERERFHLGPGASSPVLFFSKGGRDFLARRWAQAASLEVAARTLPFLETMQNRNPNFLRILAGSQTWFTGQERYAYRYANGKSAVSVSAPWVIAAHGYLAAPLDPNSMWHRDLQQHLSLYHAGAGVVFGGGNSLHEPEFSTLLTESSPLCDQVAIERPTPESQTLVCSNSGWQVRICAEVVSASEARLSATVLRAGPAAAFWQLNFCGEGTRRQWRCQDQPVRDFGAAAEAGTGATGLTVEGAGAGRDFTLKCEFSGPCAYRWPVYPVNVRAPGRQPMPLGNAVLLLKFPLGKAGTTTRVKLQAVRP